MEEELKMAKVHLIMMPLDLVDPVIYAAHEEQKGLQEKLLTWRRLP